MRNKKIIELGEKKHNGSILKKVSVFVVQLFFDLSTFDLSKIFDLMPDFSLPKMQRQQQMRNKKIIELGEKKHNGSISKKLSKKFFQLNL